VPQLARQMEQEIFEARVKQLASASKIEVFNADGSKPGAPPPPAAPPAAAAAPSQSMDAPQMPSLMPMENGAPGAPAMPMGTPRLAPATAPENLGK
jgi:hypothetical protein